MIGGDKSFGMGGWWHTAVEEALPVSMDVKMRKMRASLALVIAIDQSGSMSMTVPGGETKLSLANEAGCRVVEMLDERDKVGIVYVDTAPKWAVKIQPATPDAKKSMYGDIRSNRGGGGGIYVFTALEAAYAALDKVEAAIKHVILFSDASDSEQPEGCVERATVERRKGRTLTVIGMGQETDVDGDFLKRLARAGDGRIVFVEDVRKLPSIFTSETLTASKTALVEADFVPAVTGPATFLQGIDWSAAPKLHGYVTTTPKNRAEVVLEGTENDPLLAKWQFGLGRSLAFTSDATARWAKDWIGWDGYKRLWPQAVRWVSRRRAPTDYRVASHFEQGRGKVTLDAFDAKGEPVNFLELKAHVSGPDGKPAAARLVQRGSGRYEADFSADTSGGYFVTIADKDGAIVGQVGTAISYSPEYRAPDSRSTVVEEMLRATGGRRLVHPLGLFEHVGKPARSPQEIWPWLLSLALALLLVDVACRRIAFPELAGALWSRLLSRKQHAAEPPASPTMERLKQVKKEALAPTEAAAVERIIAQAESAPPPVEPSAAATPPAPPPDAAPPPPAEPAGGYMQRLLDAKKKAKGE
jgi:Mg-chelatase subunit ChlD